MKHIIEYHTCDRCGKELKKRNFLNKLFSKCYTQYTLRRAYRHEISNYKENDETEIYVHESCYDTPIELCSECTKEFKNFMLGKAINVCLKEVHKEK